MQVERKKLAMEAKGESEVMNEEEKSREEEKDNHERRNLFETHRNNTRSKQIQRQQRMHLTNPFVAKYLLRSTTMYPSIPSVESGSGMILTDEIRQLFQQAEEKETRELSASGADTWSSSSSSSSSNNNNSSSRRRPIRPEENIGRRPPQSSPRRRMNVSKQCRPTTATSYFSTTTTRARSKTGSTTLQNPVLSTSKLFQLKQIFQQPMTTIKRLREKNEKRMNRMKGEKRKKNFRSSSTNTREE